MISTVQRLPEKTGKSVLCEGRLQPVNSSDKLRILQERIMNNKTHQPGCPCHHLSRRGFLAAGAAVGAGGLTTLAGAAIYDAREGVSNLVGGPEMNFDQLREDLLYSGLFGSAPIVISNESVEYDNEITFDGKKK